jgi:peptidyl-prolyl cis-trans isomerase D
MLQALRNNMRHIMVVVAVAFILTIIFSWGMGGFKNRKTRAQSGILGIVNGQQITVQQFSYMVDQEIDQLKSSQNKETLTDFEIKNIRDRVWERTVQDLLMSQEVKRLNIQVTPDEIVLQLRNNPPEVIRNHESFQTDGEFDRSKFEQALRDPANYNIWRELENYYRNSLPIQKLGAWIMSTIRITEAEILEAYKMKNISINAKYVQFNPNNYTVDSLEVTEGAIHNYYKNHRDEFLSPEQRRIKYITFDLQPSPEDSALTWDEARDLIEQLKEGADFAELAKDYSDHEETADKGGDLGYFGRGDMPKAFEDAAFSAKIGQVIGPVQTDRGLHIIEVLDRKRENGETEIKARHILLEFEATPETVDREYDSATYFSDELNESKAYTFDEMAKREGYDVQETAPFGESGFVPGIGMSFTINRTVFRQKIGFVSQPVKVNNNLYVFTVSDIRKEALQPLEEVRSQIVRMVRRKIQLEKAESACRLFSEKIQTSDFLTAAQEDSLLVQETGFFNFESNIPGIGREAVFSGTAYGLDTGEVSQPVITERGQCFILKAIEKTDFNSAAFEQEKDTIAKQLYDTKMNELTVAWIENLKNRAKIEDYREDFF